MRKEECFELGFITKIHGLKGDVQVFLDVDIPEAYQKMESVLVEMDNALIPFFMNQIHVKGQKAVVHFEEIDTIEAAESLIGKSLFLPLNVLPTLESGQFYFHDVIGFDVEDKGTLIGKVSYFNSGSAQTIMVVDMGGIEVLIPVTEEIVLEAKLDEKKMLVDLPEGLIDVYKEEGQED